MGVKVDAAGNLFVLDAGNKTIRKITSTGSVSTLPISFDIAAGEGAPADLELDTAGNFYVMAGRTGGGPPYVNIYRITPNGSQTTLASLTAGKGMTIDQQGNLYVLSFDSNSAPAIFQIKQSGEISTVFTDQKSIYSYQGLAVDAAGNLYTTTRDAHSNTGHRYIVKISPSGTKSNYALFDLRNFSSELSGFTDIANMIFDAAGNLYISHYSQHVLSPGCGESNTCWLGFYESGMSIHKVTQDGTVSAIRTGPPGSTGTINEFLYDRDYGRSFIGIGQDGNIYATYIVNQTVYRISQSGDTMLIAGKPGEAGNSD